MAELKQEFPTTLFGFNIRSPAILRSFYIGLRTGFFVVGFISFICMARRGSPPNISIFIHLVGIFGISIFYGFFAALIWGMLALVTLSLFDYFFLKKIQNTRLLITTSTLGGVIWFLVPFTTPLEKLFLEDSNLSSYMQGGFFTPWPEWILTTPLGALLGYLIGAFWLRTNKI